MSSSRMTILGLYQYGQYNNDDLFENVSFPSDIDRDDVINNILEQGAAFEIIYPDYEYLKFSLGLWSKRWQRTFNKWCEALQIEYDPLNNYDRTEEWTETDSGKGTSSDSSSGQVDDFVTAYDSNELQQRDQTQTSSSGTVETSTENENVKKGRAYGNIGVTTSQQMLEAELDIAKFNLIQQITDCFLTEFCILVY